MLQGEWQGTEGIHYKADTWALGCVLYELAALRAPFEGRDLHQLMVRVMRGHVPPLPDTYSAEFQQLVSGLLKKNPSQRSEVRDLLTSKLLRPYFIKFLSSLPKGSTERDLVARQLNLDSNVTMLNAQTHVQIIPQQQLPLIPKAQPRDEIMQEKVTAVKQKEMEYLADLELIRKEHSAMRAHVKEQKSLTQSYSEERMLRLQREINGYKKRIDFMVSSHGATTLQGLLKDAARNAITDEGTKALHGRTCSLRTYCEQRLGRENLASMYGYLHRRSKGLQCARDHDGLQKDLLMTVKGQRDLVPYWTYVDELVYLDHAAEVSI